MSYQIIETNRLTLLHVTINSTKKSYKLTLTSYKAALVVVHQLQLITSNN